MKKILTNYVEKDCTFSVIFTIASEKNKMTSLLIYYGILYISSVKFRTKIFRALNLYQYWNENTAKLYFQYFKVF